MKLRNLFVAVLAVLFMAANAHAYYVVTASGTATGPIRNGQNIDWTSGQTEIVSPEVIGWYNAHTDVFTVTEVTTTGVETNLLDGSSATSPAASTAAILDSGGDLRNGSNVGTANTGVTAVEYGDGYAHHTVLTVSQTDALTVTDASAICDGYLLYTFPAGEIIIENVSMSMAVTLAEDTTATPELCIGNVIGSDAQATCGADDAGLENFLGPATADDCAGTAEVLTVATGAGTPVVVATAAAHLLHFNVCDTWANTAGTDLTGDIAGTVVVDWKFMQ